MRRYIPIVVSLICIAMFQCETAAQAPAPMPGDGPAKGKQKDYSNSSIVKKMMAFDKNGDGKLTKDEVTDPRLHRLFDRADVNKDGVVTKEELMTLAAQMEAEITDGRGREGPGDGFGRGGRGRGGRGGPGGFGGPSRPGQILPAFLQDELNLSADQKKRVGELQKQIDEKLAKILTD